MSAVDYTLCAYCRGFRHLDADGTEEIRVEHGVKRMATDCRCECHAEQVVTKASFDVRMTVTLDVLEAFLRWCEENGYTQADFSDEPDGDDVYGDGEAFAQWWAEQLLDDCGADITGRGVLTYRSDVDGFDFDPLEDVDGDKLLRLAIPKLPISPDWSPPPTGAELGMEPLFTRDEVEGP
jgi:hypothetical protein